LKFKAKNVLCTDEYVTTDASLVSLDEVLEKSDIIIVGSPHKQYKNLKISQPTVDVWNLLGNGTLI
jgi:UDP-N-acetyl-D-mannosaminuronic acid dehydrogenase